MCTGASLPSRGCTASAEAMHDRGGSVQPFSASLVAQREHITGSADQNDPALSRKDGSAVPSHRCELDAHLTAESQSTGFVFPAGPICKLAPEAMLGSWSASLNV